MINIIGLGAVFVLVRLINEIKYMEKISIMTIKEIKDELKSLDKTAIISEKQLNQVGKIEDKLLAELDKRKKECKHKWIELVEGLTFVCNKCGIVEVDGYKCTKKQSLEILIKYATEKKKSIYGDLYRKTMGIKKEK